MDLLPSDISDERILRLSLDEDYYEGEKSEIAILYALDDNTIIKEHYHKRNKEFYFPLTEGVIIGAATNEPSLCEQNDSHSAKLLRKGEMILTLKEYPKENTKK